MNDLNSFQTLKYQLFKDNFKVSKNQLKNKDVIQNRLDTKKTP